jgi:hypothetical protein
LTIRAIHTVRLWTSNPAKTTSPADAREPLALYRLEERPGRGDGADSEGLVGQQAVRTGFSGRERRYGGILDMASLFFR